MSIVPNISLHDVTQMNLLESVLSCTAYSKANCPYKCQQIELNCVCWFQQQQQKEIHILDDIVIELPRPIIDRWAVVIVDNVHFIVRSHRNCSECDENRWVKKSAYTLLHSTVTDDNTHTNSALMHRIIAEGAFCLVIVWHYWNWVV